MQSDSPRDIQEKQIFLVQCKRPDKGTTPAAWQAAVDQLEHYCCAGNLNGSTRIFGVVAIGTKVRFWRYDASADESQGPRLTPLHQGTIELLEGAGRDQAEQWLRYIYANGWDWTVSGQR